MRWVLRWPVGFCVGVGRKRGSGAAIPGEKGSRGVLGAPLTVEWVVTAEAIEALVIGQLLAASS
jgi:hypothetical protein